MTKHQAVAAASKAHGMPSGQGSEWFFSAPLDTSRPFGPRTQVYAPSHACAMLKRARRVAAMALELLGHTPEEAEHLTHDKSGRAKEIVQRAIKEKAGQP